MLSGIACSAHRHRGRGPGRPFFVALCLLAGAWHATNLGSSVALAQPTLQPELQQPQEEPDAQTPEAQSPKQLELQQREAAQHEQQPAVAPGPDLPLVPQQHHELPQAPPVAEPPAGALPPVAAKAAPAHVVTLKGLSRTRAETVLELLPRAPPAVYTELELEEFQRRLWNLGIFDLVQVRHTDRGIEVELREKWTLIPVPDFSTASTWKDTYVALSVSEYNFLGRAMLLTASVWHETRGWNGAVSLNEHAYHSRGGAWGMALEFASAELVFEESPDAWARRGGAALISWQAPLPHDSHTAYQIALGYAYEHNIDSQTRYKPHNGHQVHAELTVNWESLRASDVAPHGIQAKLTLAPGGFFNLREPMPRIGAEGSLLAAWAITGETALMAQLVVTAASRGNANYSNLLGSVDGVRGLRDAIYHTWLQGVLNVELRQAFRFAERWAVQAVLFADAAAFDRVNARGHRSGSQAAASGGIGLRLIPTFLAEVVLRVDAGRALWPEPGFFMQWGLSQYF